MKKMRLCLFVIVLPAAGLFPAAAADDTGKIEGAVEVLYRSVSQDGSDRKYEEDFDGLGSGVRLGSLTAGWLSGGDGPVDYARIDIQGLGGDPYESTRLRVGRQDDYELSFNYTKQDYLYNLFELVANEDGASWDSRRTVADLRLDVHKFAGVDLFFEYRDAERGGTSLFMKDISRQLFRLETPLDVNVKRYTVGADFELGPVDLVVRQSLRRYDNHFVNSTEGDIGLEPGVMTVLDDYEWDQRDTGGADWTTVKAHAPLGSRVDLTVGVFGTFLGDEDLRSRVNVDAEGTDANGAPLSIVDGFSDTDLNGDTTMLDANLTVKLIRPLDLHIQFRDLQRDLDGEAERDLDGSGATTLVDVVNDYDITTLSAILAYRPIRILQLRGGYRMIDRTLSRDGFGGLRDLDYDSDGDDTYIFGVNLRPLDWFRLNADYEDGEITQPFNAVAPEEKKHTRVRAVFTPKKDMRIDAGYLDYEYRNSAADFRDPGSFWDSMQEGTTLSASFWHRPSERIDYALRYAEQDVDSSVGVTFDTAGFGGTETGDSLFVNDNTQYSAHVNFSCRDGWNSFVRYWYAESDGDNVLDGDVTGIVNTELIAQEFENIEAGVTYTFDSGILLGGSFRLFDYDDRNDLLDYDGEILTLRVGTRF